MDFELSSEGGDVSHPDRGEPEDDSQAEPGGTDSKLLCRIGLRTFRLRTEVVDSTVN